MNKKTETLIAVKEQGVWENIKNFFKKLFYKQDKVTNITKISEDESDNKKEKEVVKPEKNMNFVQGQDNELLELQKKYRAGEIKETDLTKEQIKALSDLYDKQIKELRASNEARKQRLLKYREQMKASNA